MFAAVVVVEAAVVVAAAVVAVAAFGPGDPGHNPGVDRYILEFKSII